MGEDTLIIEPKNQMSHEIVGAGTSIWQWIDGQRTVSALIEQTREVFEAPSDEVEGDVLEFLGVLEQKGLIQCQNP